MGKVLTIGEALIDFIPEEKGVGLKDVSKFTKFTGGAPANVAAAVSKLGGESAFIGKLGNDGFGDFIIENLKEVNVNTDFVSRTNEANTALAFVVLKDDGDREFSFYRNPSADMLLDKDEIKEEWFNEGDILHFCSVDLIEAPVKYAHIRAIEIAKEKNCIVSFDPNVRKPLWNDLEECRKTILEFIPKADILKISSEEIQFISENDNEMESIKSFFVGDVKVVILTRGEDGVSIFTKDKEVNINGLTIDAIDTTAAGDSFIGAFLYKVSSLGIDINNIDIDLLNEIGIFANNVGAITATRKGAISSIPTFEEVENLKL